MTSWQQDGGGLAAVAVRLPRTAEPPPSGDSLLALDWLNGCLAALLTGFGPVFAVYLADRGWTPARIGFVLTASGLAGLLAQIPAGELIDTVAAKRALVATASAAIGAAVLVFGLRSDFPSVFAAALLQGTVGSFLGPGIAAISLGLVGHEALSDRLGRNQRFASIGSLTASGVLGVVGYVLPAQDRFLLTAALAVPVVVAIANIRAADIHYGRACGAPDCDTTRPERVDRAALFKDRRLVTFAVCLFLFQLANASMLPVLGEGLVRAEGKLSWLVVSALIVAPQIIVALLAPWVGRTAGKWGRRPLLLLGLAVVPVRAAVFAMTADPALLVSVQMLDGLTGAILGVLTALVVADLTAGTGRFNLAQGLVGTASGVGASVSTSLSGLVIERFGEASGFFGVTAVALASVAILWLFMPETKPQVLRRQRDER